MEVFDRGKIIETFNYMGDFDLENSYVGYLIQLNDTVYQVIATKHNMLIDPEGDAEIFTTDINDVYYQIEQSMNEPLRIETKLVNDFEEKSDIEVDDEVIKYKGRVVVNRFTNESIFDQYKDIDAWKRNDDDMPNDGTKGDINNNIIDFNRPW